MLFSAGALRLRGALAVSARAGLTVLVFLTAIGGMEGPLELMEEPGLMLCELPGRWGIGGSPTDGILLCPFESCVPDVCDGSDSALDIRLRRLADCSVGCV